MFRKSTGNNVIQPCAMLILFLIGLGGCQPVTPPPATSNIEYQINVASAANNQNESILTVSEGTSTNQAGTAIIAEDNASVSEPEQAVTVATIAITPAPSLPAKPALPRIRPASQNGKLKDDVMAAIGIADFIRQEGQIEIWQYHQPDCVVDFYFPADSTEAEARVLSWDMRPRIFGRQLDIQQCENQIAERTP